MVSKSAVGLIETSSIALGVRAADAMLKTAAVELLAATATSPGKYLALVGGDVAGVAAAVEAGAEAAGPALLDSLLIANLHPSVYPAIRGEAAPEAIAALGVVETFTVAAAIRAADAAVKAANVRLVEVRLARGLGGKGYLSFTGDVGSVQAGVQAAEAEANRYEALVASVVIPNPHADLKARYLKSG